MKYRTCAILSTNSSSAASSSASASRWTLPGDHRDLRPHPARRRPGPAVREAEGLGIPLLGNLFGTPGGSRWAWARNRRGPAGGREAAGLAQGAGSAQGHEGRLAEAAGVQEGVGHGPQGAARRPARRSCSKGDGGPGRLPDPDLLAGRRGPLITWGLVVTRGPDKPRQNLGIYRMQVLGRNRVIMRWLAHRGGALDFREWQQATRASRSRCRSPWGRPGHHPGGGHPGAGHPVGIRLRRPAARQPHRGRPLHGQRSAGPGLRRDRPGRPYHPDDMAAEGPFGDHTGYYNEVDSFPSSPSSASPSAATPSTTAPTPAGRRTSRPSWAWP